MSISQFYQILSPGPLTRLRKVQDRHHPSAPLVFFSSTGSTQDEAKATRFGPGSVLVALNQTRGRGRDGRSWDFVRGNLAVSWVCEWEAGEKGALLPLYAATAVHLGLSTFGVKTQLKWPNDVLLNGGKLAGILVDARTRMVGGEAKTLATVGLGLNVWTPEGVVEAGQFSPAGLDRELAAPPHCLEVLAAVLDQFWRMFPHDGFHGAWLGRYNEALAMRGERVRVENGGESLSGILRGVAGNGGVQVLLPGGESRTVMSGRMMRVDD